MRITAFILGRKTIAGSISGVTAINDACERAVKGDVKYRFVIDGAAIHDTARIILT